MSPSEFDLRAALHDGEGGELDVDRIVAGGQAKQARRRMQVLTASIAVVLLAAAGTVGAFLVGGNGSSRNDAGGLSASGTAASAAGAQPPGYGEQASSGAPAQTDGVPRASTGGSDSAIPCPASFPTQLLPGGGGSGQFGASGPLFPAPAGSIVVCSYGAPLAAGRPGSTPGRLVLTGSDARLLQASLEGAAKSRSGHSCPLNRSNDQHPLALIGVDGSGRPEPAVTTILTDPPCDVKVTNGTAVRYDWTPPAGLGPRLLAQRPPVVPTGALPSHQPSGKNHGSPVR